MIIGIILSGGQSARMGQDKGLMTSNGITWVHTIHGLMTNLRLPVKVSVNRHQFETYAKQFERSDLIEDDLSLQVHGPLLGVLSAHQVFPADDLLIVACDMAHMRQEVIQLLVTVFEQQKSGAVVFKGDRVEPLCGIYSGRSLKEVIVRLKTGKLEGHSMMHILETIDTNYLSIPREWRDCFQNFNSPSDLK